MKRKIKHLLLGTLPLFGMLLAGCSFGEKSTSSSSIEPYVPPEGDPEEPEIADNHITAIHMSRTKDFFMQREEVLSFHITFDGGGDESEKGITWVSSNPNVIKVSKNLDNPDKSWYCTLTALREGTSALIARSTYNPSLTASVSITCLDNSDYTYVWQKTNASSSKENKDFNDEYGRPKTEGKINLGSMEWSYQFDKAPIAVGGGQSLKFGSKDNPYGALHFEAENTKQIRKISVLCSSAAEHIDDGSAHGRSGDVGTSNITIKVGDTTYVDNVSTPKNSNDSSIELDTVTGGIRDTNPMTGKISIDFSPTYYDGSTKENSGAIYLKAIIVEYYRGDLDRIEVDVINDYNTQFFVGTKFDARGYDVNAYFSASPSTKVNVGYLTTYEMDNLDEYGNFIAANPSQTITAKYTYTNSEGVDKTVTANFTVNVAKAIKKLEITGTLEKTSYLLREEMSYAGLSLDIVVDDDTTAQSFNLSEAHDDKFLAVFDTSNVQKYALKSMEDEFSMSFKHYLTDLRAYYNFDARELTVKVVTGIEVIYDSETPLALVEGTKIDFTNFKAKISYDAEDPDEFSFDELKNQTYHDEASGYDLYRYNYITESPFVADKVMASEGLTITVASALSEAKGSLKFETTDFSIKYITAINVKGELTQKAYEEADNLNFDGLTLDITYSDESVDENVPYADFIAMTTQYEKPTKNKGNINAGFETKNAFEISAPEQVSLDLVNGFDISIAYERDKTISSTYHVEANAISVTPVASKKYTQVKSASDFVEGGNYIIVSMETGNQSMQVWDADLPETGDVTVLKGGNYFLQTHSEKIGEELIIKSGKLSRATFVLNSLSGDPVKYSIKHPKSGKYYNCDSALNTGTSSDKTNFLMSFNDEDPNVDADSIGLRAIHNSVVKYIRFNTSTNKFGGYDLSSTTTKNNTKQIRLYRLVGDVK